MSPWYNPKCKTVATCTKCYTRCCTVGVTTTTTTTNNNNNNTAGAMYTLLLLLSLLLLLLMLNQTTSVTPCKNYCLCNSAYVSKATSKGSRLKKPKLWYSSSPLSLINMFTESLHQKTNNLIMRKHRLHQ